MRTTLKHWIGPRHHAGETAPADAGAAACLGIGQAGPAEKAPGTKAVPTLITVEPHLLRQVDAYAKKAGVSRSELFSDAVRRRPDLAK